MIFIIKRLNIDRRKSTFSDSESQSTDSPFQSPLIQTNIAPELELALSIGKYEGSDLNAFSIGNQFTVLNFLRFSNQ